MNWKDPGTDPVKVSVPRARSADTEVPAGGAPAATRDRGSPLGSVSFETGSMMRGSPTRAT